MNDTRPVLFALLIGVALAGVVMVVLHGEHYRSRRDTILEARIEALEKILQGRHKG